MRKYLIKLLHDVFIIGIISFILLELTLRIIPSIIPPKILFLFEPGLRSTLADGRFLTGKDRTPVKRDDKGEPLSIWKPYSKIHYFFTDPGVTNDLVMDETGFCNPEGTYQNSTIDIIAIGDSYTFCFTVLPEETWTKRFSDYTGLRSYNLGLIGVGVYEYIQLLKYYGLQKSPTVVIMNVYEANDLQNAVDYWNYRNSKGVKPAPENPFEKVYDYIIKSWIGKHSYAVNLILSSTAWIYVKTKDDEQNDKNYQYYLDFPEGKVPFNLQNTDLDEIESASKVASGNLGFDLFNEGLKQFTEIAKSHHFIPIVTYSPSVHTGYQDFAVFEDTSLTNILKPFSQKQRAYFKEKGSELGYCFVDLTPAFRKAAPAYNHPDKLLYYQSSLHLTRFGHEVIASEISRVIDSLEIVKTEKSAF
jgi:hypothetical protein